MQKLSRVSLLTNRFNEVCLKGNWEYRDYNLNALLFYTYLDRCLTIAANCSLALLMTFWQLRHGIVGFTMGALWRYVFHEFISFC